MSIIKSNEKNEKKVIDSEESEKTVIEEKIMKKKKDSAKWNIDLKMVDLKENRSFSCMSAYYKFTINDKLTMIWFREDINFRSPMYARNFGNYFDDVREQIMYITFKSKEGKDNTVSFTKYDLEDYIPIYKISAEMYSTSDLKNSHDDFVTDIDYFGTLIQNINDVCVERFITASENHLIYPGIRSSCWKIFE